MKALVYNGPRDVGVVEHPDPRIEDPNDALIRVTATNICGSDLHMYEGRTSLEPGRIIGQENLGEVVEVGPGVARLQVGDMVCVPFNASCGFCRNCEERNTGACLTMVPGQAGAGYGYAEMGEYWGGQAEFLRVPFADFNCLRLPEDAREKDVDYVMLADIWPTGWHATRLSGLVPGESMTVFGSGPVGLMAAYSSILQGADQVFVIDRHPDRLRLAEQIGAIPVDDSDGTHVARILEQTGGRGTDRGCECVGWQAHDPEGDEHPEMTMGRPGPGGARGRWHRLRRGLRAGGSGRPGRARQAGQDGLRLRPVLAQGPERRDGPGAREAVQPPPPRPHPPWPRDTIVGRLP